MNIVQNAEIHFHQQEQISVFLESNAWGDDEKIGEIAMTTLFAIRMLSNLNVNETSDKLATFLTAAPEAVHEFASRSATGGFELISYPGVQGRKRFLAHLRMTDDDTRFDVKPKGFGLLATGVGYYAPMAVIALIRQLAEKRKAETPYLDALGVAAASCGQLHLQRQITLTNHGQLAFAILGQISKLLLGATPDPRPHASQPAVNGQSAKTSSFVQLLDQTRNFVTIMTINTYPDRESQRCIPTFVTVAGGILHTIHERGGLRTKCDFDMGDLTAFIGHLNMLWMATFFGDKTPVSELTEQMRGLGYAYHLTDDQIVEWQNTVHNCHGDESAIAQFVSYFDRIVEPIAQIFGPEDSARMENWITLLGDINTAYHKMMENAAWIARVDSALNRA